MRIDQSNASLRALRLFGLAVVLFGVLVLALLLGSGGASAAPGDADLSITKTDSPDPVVAN
jgi:hypothetical protein